MSTFSRVRALWRALRCRRSVDRDLTDEIQFAVDELAARHAAAGHDPTTARRLAILDVGGIEALKEQIREVRPDHAVEVTMSDVRYAIRALARTPRLTALLVLTMALGIGASTAVFSIVNVLLMAPLPYRDADRLVFVWQDLTRAGYPRAPLAGPELQDLRDRTTLFDGFGGIWANTRALTDREAPEQLRVGLVTADFFDILGVAAAHGRTFAPGDDYADPTILLSHAVWQRRYGTDPTVVGRSIEVNGGPVRVIGVMPETFRLLLPADSAIPDDLQAWLLLPPDILRGSRQQQFVRVVGRMKPGVTLEDAAHEVASIAARLGREFPDYRGGPVSLYAVALKADAMRELRPALMGLFASTLLLLAVACGNVAGLLVTRASARRHETALRLALGATRVRLVRQYAAEGFVIAAAGAIVGVALAEAFSRALSAWRPASMSRIDLAAVDGTVLAFVAGATAIWGVVFSIFPSLQWDRADVAGALRYGGRGASGVGSYRARATLVVLQIAMSMVLIAGAGLIVRAFAELRTASLGFDARSVVTFRLSLSGERYRNQETIASFSQQLRERLEAIPGARSVGAISHLPFDTLPNWGSRYVPDGGTRDEADAGLADSRSVSPGYFETVKAELLEGRWFTEADGVKGAPVAIVDSSLAERAWPGRSAIGRQLLGDPGTTGVPQVRVTVVGVVRHIRHRDITRDLREQIYFPSPQSLRNPMAFVVRADANPAALVPAIRRVVAAQDPRLPVYDVKPLEAYVGHALSVRAFAALLGASFGAAALLLAGIGLYGALAYAVAQRRREFGVRLALGATPSEIRRLVLHQASRLALPGILAGSAGAYVAASLLKGVLYNISPHDPFTYAAALAVVVGAVLVSSWSPARRAAGTAPADALKGS
jgi:predicted permease